MIKIIKVYKDSRILENGTLSTLGLGVRTDNEVDILRFKFDDLPNGVGTLLTTLKDDNDELVSFPLTRNENENSFDLVITAPIVSQLSLTFQIQIVNDTEVWNSLQATLKVHECLEIGQGEMPSVVDNWLTNANIILSGMEDAESTRNTNENSRVTNERLRVEAETERESYITNLQQRVDNGEFNGKDGSPGPAGPAGPKGDKGDPGTTDYNDLTNKPNIPSKTSDLINDNNFINNAVDNLINYYKKSETYTQTEVNNLIAQINQFKIEIVQTLPTTNIDTHTIYLVPKNGITGDVYDEYLYVNNSWEKIGSTEIDLSNYYTISEVDDLLDEKVDNSDLSLVATSGSYNDLTNKPTIPSSMTILSYGNSTWNNFISAYNNNAIVYCRASSNSNPASGSQTRLAFMAYVNNETNPTEVEFQYYRSVSSHTSTQQGDQVFVYKLTSGGTWSVTTREASSKIVAGTNMSSSYSNDTLTLSANLSGYATETYVQNAISGISGGDSIFVLDPSDYTNRTIVLEGLKKGLYIWNDLNDTFRFKLNDSNTSTYQIKIKDKIAYVLEDVTSDLADNTKLVYSYKIQNSIVSPYIDYEAYLYKYSSANSGLGGTNISEKSYVMANNGYSQIIDGVKTFSNFPITSGTPTSDTQLVNKKYVDDSIASAITDALGGSY